MDSDLIELCRWRDTESADETKRILERAEIPFRIGSTGPVSDISYLGTGATSEIIVSIRRSDFDAARDAIEQEFLQVELPDDHHLLTATNDELAEILGKPSEWSPFDVAHARRLSKAKGVDLGEIEKKKTERIQKLEQGKPAPTILLYCGWVCSFLGGFIWLLGSVIGIGIASSLLFLKEKTPEGEFFTYDQKSREIGKPMLVISVAMGLIGITLRFWSVLLG